MDNELLEWAREKLIDDVEQLYDDPCGAGGPGRAGVTTELAKLSSIAGKLGLSIDVVVASCTQPFERSRMEKLLSKEENGRLMGMSLAQRHQDHYTSCNCLANADECCVLDCPCHEQGVAEPLEDHSEDPSCTGQWCCGCESHPIGKPWGWNVDAWDRHYSKAHPTQDKKSET